MDEERNENEERREGDIIGLLRDIKDMIASLRDVRDMLDRIVNELNKDDDSARKESIYDMEKED